MLEQRRLLRTACGTRRRIRLGPRLPVLQEPLRRRDVVAAVRPQIVRIAGQGRLARADPARVKPDPVVIRRRGGTAIRIRNGDAPRSLSSLHARVLASGVAARNPPRPRVLRVQRRDRAGRPEPIAIRGDPADRSPEIAPCPAGDDLDRRQRCWVREGARTVHAPLRPSAPQPLLPAARRAPDSGRDRGAARHTDRGV